MTDRLNRTTRYRRTTGTRRRHAIVRDLCHEELTVIADYRRSVDAEGLNESDARIV